MVRRIILAFSLWAAYCLATAALAETVTVKDVRSLSAALDRARVHRQITRIELAAGTYALPAPIALDEGLSGTPDAPFVLTGAPGAHPVLSGAEDLPRLRWQPWKNGIWRARVAHKSFQRLWIGAHMLIRARFPNHDANVAPFGGVSADATSQERVARWRNPAGGVLHALHGGR
jgi:hypothetical protein